MPAQTDYTLYFNLIYFGVIALGFIIGYFRGLRKTLYSLIVMLIIYIVFFVTIDSVVAYLWHANLPSITGLVSTYIPAAVSTSSIGEMVFSLIEYYGGDYLSNFSDNVVLVELVTGLTMFVLKLMYALIYFTIGVTLLRFFFYIIRLLFFNAPDTTVILDYQGQERKVRTERAKRKYQKELKKFNKRVKSMMRGMERKDKKEFKKNQAKLAIEQKKFEKKQKQKEKKQILSAFVGATKGAVGAFISIIMIGGFLNISESFLTFIPEDNNNNYEVVNTYLLSTEYDPFSADITPSTLAEESPLDSFGALDSIRDITYAYNNNAFVKFAYKLEVKDDNYMNELPLSLYLFDRVFSFFIEEDKIMVRHELQSIAEVTEVVTNSAYLETNNLSDITGEEIQDLFDIVANSKFITKMIPLAIEVGSNSLDVPLVIPKEELYEIDWASEISSLGAVAASAFSIINIAGLLDENPDYTTATFSGAEVRGLFDALSESELVRVTAYVAIEPLLEDLGSDVQAIITVPESLVWEDEFKALGEIAEVILNTNITVAELQENDPNVYIQALSDIDFTVLLKSTLISHAMKNVFDGTAEIEGLDMIVIPEDIEWFDTYDTLGELESAGELRHILEALNAIADVATEIDLSSFSLDFISEFDDDTIDSIFNSEVLVASISDYVINMDFGSAPIVIPDSALDENDYLLKDELKTIANAAVILVDELTCDETTSTCESYGFDLTKAFSLSDTSIDTLISSKIIGASVGQLIIDNSGTFLTVPPRALETIQVRGLDRDVVSEEEIKTLFKAASSLELTDFNNLSFDPGLFNVLIVDGTTNTLDTTKTDIMLDSYIIHATISQTLFDQASAENSLIHVPYFAAEEATDPATEDIIYYSVEDDMDYISKAELTRLVQGFLTLDIENFTSMSELDISSVVTDASTLLESSIMQATVSEQVINLGEDIVIVPNYDIDNNVVRINVGDELAGTNTSYLSVEEIEHILDAMQLLGFNDLNNFDGIMDLATVFDSEESQDLLLNSAIIHATFSSKVLELTGDILIVPHYTQDGETTANQIRFTIDTVEYISKTEIKAMINALFTMDYENLEELDIATVSGQFFENRDLLFESASLQATISDKIINGSGDLLVIPDNYYNTATDLRIVQTHNTYIDIDEIYAIMDALEELGLTDFTSLSFDPATVLDGDFSIILESEVVQATISNYLLPSAGDETTPDGSMLLIVPTEFRQNIVVDTVASEQIEKGELELILNSLTVMTSSLDDFESGLDPSFITDLTGSDLDLLLESASIHATADNMLRGNGLIDVPEQAEFSPSYKSNITTRAEIKYFIQAIQAVAGEDFTTSSISLLSILSLDASGRDTVATSMIIRNSLTDEFEALCSNPIDPYTLTNADYMSNNPSTFLTKQAIFDIIAYYYG